MEKYIIVEEHNMNKFIRVVNEKIDLGYVPQGGISTSIGGAFIRALFLSGEVK